MSATEHSDPWQIFFTLTGISSSDFREQPVLEGEHADREACLRRVLRPHDEAGFSGMDEWEMIDWREKLDDALGDVTLREIRRELGLPHEPLPPGAQERLLLLFRSEAFLRYLNAYHYFGVRFVPFWPEIASTIGDPFRLRPRPCGDANVPNSALAAPPRLTTLPDAEVIFEEFAKMVRSDDTGKVHAALRFLDGFENPETRPVLLDLKEPTAFELWLRGLRPETSGALKSRFEDIAEGITEWATMRADFYLSLSKRATAAVKTDRSPEAEVVDERPPEGWMAGHPATARLALADVYWIAKIFRADLSSEGIVSYQKYNWIHLIRFRATFDRDMGRVNALNRAEEALRSVFDYVCDLVQNSVEVTKQRVEELADRSTDHVHEQQPRTAVQRRGKPSAVRRDWKDRPSTTVAWRAAFDEELKEIEAQRGVRHYRDPTLAPQATSGDLAPLSEPGLAERATVAGSAVAAAARKEADRINRAASEAADGEDGQHLWSRRLLGSRRPANLIGLAFSGGGIRSATLNLGVLQGLQELDLLRHFDYISTVSGGGFIGSWLIGNVRRSAHWLGRLTDWSPSIEHLRKYSNYLAPRTGLLSPDTLNIGNTWLRNTILIQLSALAWLFVLLLSALATMRAFLWAGRVPWLDSVLLSACSLVVMIALLRYLAALPGTRSALSGRFGRTRSVVWYAVLPASIGTTALASRFWAAAPHTAGIWPCLDAASSFGEMLGQAWKPWWPLLALSALGIALLASITLQRRRIDGVAAITIACTGVLYLELVALFHAFRSWSQYGDGANSVAFVFGPPVALLAFALVILLLIGLSSKSTNEAQREWWTRYGTWLSIYGGASVVVCGVALFGPKVVLIFFGWFHQSGYHVVPWATVVGWIGTVVGGLLAGKSSQTAGNGEGTKSQLLEALAKVAGVLFILGSFLLGSTLLYILLLAMSGTGSAVIGSDPLKEFCTIAGWRIWAALGAMALVGWIFSARFEINIFGFSQFYRNRLVRCYLGATRWMPGARKPNPFTKFDFRDDIELWRFRTDSPGEDLASSAECDPYRGPFPLLNCSLNLAGSSDLELNTRHGASFTLTPLRCGSARSQVGYAPTWSAQGKFADGVQLGQAVAVSGAAVSSNMGYNTSSLVAFLLTMFNVRLGWWFPNPGRNSWTSHGLTNSLKYLLAELFGDADEKLDFVNVSDGGHFENLGIYELVRRRCRIIIACDAECDPELQFPSLGKMIRNCATDFGAEIDLNVDSIRRQPSGLSLAHCAVGTIQYCTGEIGRLIYLKASISGDEDVSVAQYRSQHPAFPHESTANQFYSEDQFESYRRLGLEMVRTSFKGNLPGDDPILIGDRMFDVLTPAALSSDRFLSHSKTLDNLWEHFRGEQSLHPFMNELIASTSQAVTAAAPARTAGGVPVISDTELAIGLQLIQLMEDVFLDLRLDDYWQHPDYRGWAILFMRWARSERFREIWKRTHRTFGIRFEYFCNANLGLTRDQPIARV